MTGPLVGVTVLQPASGTVVLPGQAVTCSGRATGHGGLLTAVVDRVVLNLDGGSGIEASLSPVVSGRRCPLSTGRRPSPRLPIPNLNSAPTRVMNPQRLTSSKKVWVRLR